MPGRTRSLRSILACALAAGAILSTSPTRAQPSSSPITIVVPYPAGGGNDLFARLIASNIAGPLGRQCIVDNRSGASGSIGTAAVARAPADGSTLLYAASTIALSHSIYRNLPFDASRDLKTVTITLTIPLVLVSHPSLPVGNGREFLAFVRAHPGALTYSSGGVGSAPHFAMEALKLKTGLDVRHVPYRGAAPSLTALISGETQVSFIVPPLVAAYVQGKKLKALAISSAERSDALPDVETLREAGVRGYEALQWHGFFVPAKTPEDVVGRLYNAVASALDSPEMKAKLASAGAKKVATPPREAEAFFQKEIVDWAEVATRARIAAP